MGKIKKVQKSNKPKNKTDIYLLIGFLSLILLHVLGGFWHSFYSWGFSYWSVMPQSLTIIFGITSIGSILTVYVLRNKINLDFIDKLQFSSNSTKISFSVITSILLTFILFMFRSQAHVYGDGYSILEFCSVDTALEIKDQYFLQLLAVYWHQFIFKVLSPISFFEKENIFALTNIVGGVIGFWGVYKISGLLSRNTKERIFFLIISLSSASIILFFGYIENYTWAMSFMLWSIYYSIRYLYKTCSIFPLLICSLIAFAFHMITLPILVTVFFVILYRINSFKKFFNNLRRLHFVIFIVIGSLFILLLSQFKQMTVFVPLWGITDNNYSLFALSHLLDIVNLFLLLAPLGLLFFLIFLKDKNKEDFKNDSSEKVLFIISLFTFLSACFIDPQLGMIRDWDLFSFYGIPLTLWGGYRFSRIFSDKQFPVWIIITSSIIVLVHIVPNLYEKNHPQIAVEYLDEVLWEDPHYQSDYQDSYRGQSWALILRNELSRIDLSDKYYSRRLKSDSSDPTILYNFGLMHNKKNQLDSARYYLQKGNELYPQEPKFLSKLSEIECKSRNFQLAENYARESLAIDSNYIKGITALAIVFTFQNKMQEALTYFRKAYDLEPNAYKNILNLGSHYAKGINTDSAIYYFNKVVPLAPEKQKIDILGGLISMALHLNRKAEAIEYLNQLKSIAPNSPLVLAKEKEIYGK